MTQVAFSALNFVALLAEELKNLKKGTASMVTEFEAITAQLNLIMSGQDEVNDEVENMGGRLVRTEREVAELKERTRQEERGLHEQLAKPAALSSTRLPGQSEPQDEYHQGNGQ